MWIEGQKEEEYSERLEKVVQGIYGYKSVTKLLKPLKLITKDKIIFVRQNIDYLTGNKIHLTIILYLTTFWLFGNCVVGLL